MSQVSTQNERANDNRGTSGSMIIPVGGALAVFAAVTAVVSVLAEPANAQENVNTSTVIEYSEPQNAGSQDGPIMDW